MSEDVLAEQQDERWTLTRRQALQAGGVGIGALLSPGLLSACGSGSSATPTLHGRVAMGLSFPPVTLDPHVLSDLTALTIRTYTYDGLYGRSVTPPYRIQPQLATGDPELVGRDKARVTIRAGAKFNDGRPLTAHDVQRSFERFLDPKTAALTAKFLDMVEGVRAVDDTTVEFALAYPTVLLKDRLALVMIVPASRRSEKASAAVWNHKVIGSGPYRAASVSNDLRTVSLDRSREYNGPIKPTLGAIAVNTITDDQARVAALETRRLAAMVDPPFNAIGRLDKQPSVDAGGKLGFLQSLLTFNNQKPPFNDKRVRQAIFHAIDREVITKSVLFGYGKAASSYLPANWPGYKQPATSLVYDPERARSLLKQAGVTNLSFDFIVQNQGWLTPQAPLLQSQLLDVGIKVNLKIFEPTAALKAVTEGSFSVRLAVTDPTLLGNSDATFLVQWIYVNLAPTFYYWTDAAAKRMIGLCDRATRSTSDDEVTQLVGEMQDLIAEEVPAFPLHHRDTTAGWSRGLQVELDPIYGVNLLEAKRAG